MLRKHKDDQIQMAQFYQERLKAVRDGAELLEKDLLEFQERLRKINTEAQAIDSDIERFLTTWKTDADIMNCVSLLQDAAKGIQSEVNDYIHDACLHLILTTEQEEEQEQEEREAEVESFYSLLHENSFRQRL